MERKSTARRFQARLEGTSGCTTFTRLWTMNPGIVSLMSYARNSDAKKTIRKTTVQQEVTAAVFSASRHTAID